MTYSPAQKTLLLDMAKKSISYGLQHGKPLPIDIRQYEKPLQCIRAVFVTLEKQKQLRGCIGTLQAHEPLIEAIVHYAFEAAFHDPRFSPVTIDEVEVLDIHLSILTPPVKMSFTSEEDLLRQLRPHVDGLILTEKYYSGTFLPSVWSQLPDPKAFLNHLKMKAGLPEHYWSKTIQIQRYTAELIE
jgi:AmmeMemoRadiSam system protein A